MPFSSTPSAATGFRSRKANPSVKAAAACEAWLGGAPGRRYRIEIDPRLVRETLAGVPLSLHDWGALDTLVARGWADPKNLFLMGNSYGGIATDWIITQTSRFKAAASSSGVADYTASFGVDDDHIEWMADMGGAPWQVPERYRAQSAMTYIDRVKTPTIFLHGDDDHICPVGESERMYLALRLLGVDSKLVIFPGENHNFDARASSYPTRSRMILDWFDEHRGK